MSARLRSPRMLKLSLLALLLAAAAGLPWYTPDIATMNLAIFTIMYVGLASAWNIMGGYSGYISLGHAAFFGFGAYTLGLILIHLNIGGEYGPFLFVPVAGALTGVLALGVGWIALRTRAATFVIVTIAFMFIGQLLAENLVGLTGGGAGLGFPSAGWGPDFYTTPFYFAMLLLALMAVFCSWWIRRSKFGLGLLAIRDDEDKALAVGVPTRAFKLSAFTTSAVLVGMIGAVYGYYITYIYPQFVFDPLVGISMVLMVFLGGLGTISGPVLGALILEPAQLQLAYHFGASRLYLIFYAAVFLLVILLLPRGIIPSVADLVRRRKLAMSPPPPEAAPRPMAAP